jgi:LPS-assembly lipoprotein
MISSRVAKARSPSSKRGAGRYALAAVLLLAGCGFHLRTYDINTSVSSVYLSSNSANLVAEPLRRGLKQAGVTLAAEADEAEVTVALLNQRRDQRSVSVTPTAREAESELTLAVQYAVTAPGGAELVPPRWIETARIYRIDRLNILGSSEERSLLEQEMINDLVQQIVRALDAATREMPVAG